MNRSKLTIDGNEAVAHVAYQLSEVVAIYPITPSSPMGEWADQWASEGKPNLWGMVPRVIEMQSEGGAAGALHGALQAGSLATTFTASQGLLLMIPNMYKIAGELTPCVIHVAARSLATHALSIFGDHSDVMAARQTGFAMLASNSVQEAMDLALIAHASTLEARLPFLHFFDGFRTSHEVAKVEQLSSEDVRALIDEELVRAHRDRALTPERPFIRGTAQNPDVYFQSREAANPFYLACPAIVQNVMDKFARVVGRQYHLFDYVGACDAERVIVIVGSGAEAVEETVTHLSAGGEKVGVLKVRLCRPFSVEHFIGALPATVKSIAVLDRTKEPGSTGEPLYMDVVTAIHETLARRLGGSADFQSAVSPTSNRPAVRERQTVRRLEICDTADWKSAPLIIGGRYGLSSKEFTPAMIKAVFDELAKPDPKNHFTLGILDDVTHTSLDFDPSFSTEDPRTVRAVFYGLGSDGTVGANKNSIKIIGEDTDNHAQGYFVYDSKKSGSVTISYLRFGPNPIRSTYLITRANFVACHQFPFLERLDVLRSAEPGATFLLNSPYGQDEVWEHLPNGVQRQMIDKNLRFFVIDGYRVAKDTGMGGRINTIMQTCFFAISGVLPREQAVAAIKHAIEKTYGKRGEAIVQKNFAAVDATLDHLHEVNVPTEVTARPGARTTVPENAPDFVRKVTAPMIAGEGDELPVSAFPVDGTYPTGTTQWEKRNIALEIPVWDADLCIQCGKCVLVCPHAVIRSKVCDPALLKDAPPTFHSAPARWKGFGPCPQIRSGSRETSAEEAGTAENSPFPLRYTLQVAPEDCTGCTLCVEVCPVKSKSEVKHKAINMMPQPPLRETEAKNWEFFLRLPEIDRRPLNLTLAKDVQLLQPLFEFSGACAGCGETPYIKLLTQLFGDRAIVANATGCSSIYGGNLPTTPWCANREGRGPAWSNSLFEDNAEFGLGMRLSLDQQAGYAQQLLKKLAPQLGDELAKALLDADQSDEAGIQQQRERVKALKEKLRRMIGEDAEPARDNPSPNLSPKGRGTSPALGTRGEASSSSPLGGEDKGEGCRARAEAGSDSPGILDARALIVTADALVKKSVWIVGGDGWAYDIGFGGLDHVLASHAKVNVLVLDTEVYSNTGGQMSKSTPRGAVAKFAAGGKPGPKKDLAMMAMTYGSIYIARIAMGANDTQTIKAFLEAEAYDGPSLIIAYSHCIAHGYDLSHGLDQQKAAVQSGHWPMFRFNPALVHEGKNPLQLDSKAPSLPLEKYVYNEARYAMLARSQPEAAKKLLESAQADIQARWKWYEHLAAKVSGNGAKEEKT